MQTRTICCKFLTTQAMYEALLETSCIFANACNFVLGRAIEENTCNAIKLHRLCYAQIRELFKLSANLSVRALRRVAACMTRLKGRRRRPKDFKPKSIDYDARPKEREALKRSFRDFVAMKDKELSMKIT